LPAVAPRRADDPAQPLFTHQYRSLFEHHPDAMFVFDLERRFSDVNAAAERISGYRCAELLGRSADELFVPHDRARALRAFGRVLRGGAANVGLTIRRKDGERLDLQLALAPAFEQDVIAGAFGIARDVTAERRTEAERTALLARATAAERRAGFLADAGALLSASLDYEETLASLTTLIVPDLADWCAIDIATADGGVRRLLGASEPVLGAQIAERERQFRSALVEPAVVERLLWVIRRGRSVFVPEVNAGHLVALAIDDEDLRLLQRVGISSFMRVPLCARGQTLGAISFTSADSGRRFTKADLALAEELGRRAGLAVDNARLYQEARQAVQLRDEFLATASHDLRTPVTSIKAFAQMLARRASRAEQVPSAEVLDTVRAIDAAASRITVHLNELLDRSCLHAGRPLDLDRRPTDLVALCRQVIAAQQPLAEGGCIELDADPPSLLGIWDGVRLERALGNLVSNAIKYSSGSSEVLITVRRRDEAGQPSAVLRVIDRGIGIPERDLPRVFERFFRAANAGDRAPGTGIGLAGAREIVRQHGGEITIVSREGEGTTVTVVLPLGREPEPPARI